VDDRTALVEVPELGNEQHPRWAVEFARNEGEHWEADPRGEIEAILRLFRFDRETGKIVLSEDGKAFAQFLGGVGVICVESDG